jgi:hypothetical protein
MAASSFSAAQPEPARPADVPVSQTGPGSDVVELLPPGPGRDTAGHGHLWHLADGTGSHAPPATVVREPDTGEACCHLCGRWFRALGSHVRVHGLSAARYRALVGLSKSRSLLSADLTAALSARQHRAYWSSPEVRERFAYGQNLARSGQLAARRRSMDAVERPETVALRAATLASGRATITSRRHARRQATLASAGAGSLADYLRANYASGASIDALRIATGLGRARLRTEMDAADIVVRPTGVNTREGKRSRARRADHVAAARVDTNDLGGWLRQRRGEGWTLTQLGEAVGHSTHWVRWRLEPDDDHLNSQHLNVEL